MTQQPVGEVVLRDRRRRGGAAGRAARISTTARVRLFHAAVRGEGQPSATGEDGVWSLATGLAVRDAAAERPARSRSTSPGG